ncbi:hypothetical protein [Paludibaculum fermentans]|uniref:hypothetical protein n=1 Tax=Paludibaculum fermentans TaxID=1473598 RepID=UPI003EB96BC5
MRTLLFSLLLVFSSSLFGGTTVIHVDTEGSGAIVDTDGKTLTAKGAAFWNGTKWVTNDTAAHMYFTDVRTGTRLKAYTTTLVQGNQPGAVSVPGGTATLERSTYTYQKATASGVYQFRASQYRLAVPQGETVVLRSRGTGKGSGGAYFDIYIEHAKGTVLAIRGDPIAFQYAMGVDQALQQTSTTSSRLWSLPSSNGDYFFDANGGSDMGGVSYHFHTADLALEDSGLGMATPFAADFSYQWMDKSNTLQELRFIPYIEQVLPGGDVLSGAGALPQVASGGGWKTTFTTVNLGSAQAQTRISFFNDAGTALSLPLRPISAASRTEEASSSIDNTLPSGASAVVVTEAAGDVKVGWGDLLASGAVGGFAIFRANGQEAVVPLEDRKADKYVLWYDNTAGSVTSMAMSNASGAPVVVEAVVRAEDGSTKDTRTIKLPAQGHAAFELVKQLAVTADSRGSVEFRSPGGMVSMLGLRFRGSAITTIPVLTAITGGGSMTHIASGGGWKTTITLVNQGTAPAPIRLNFYAGDGQPLLLPLGQGESVDTTARTLAPGASLILESEGPSGSPTLSGWAELVTDGAVGGFAIFQSGGQEAVVPIESRRTGTDVLWYDNTAGFVTSVAIANPSAAAAVFDVIVRNEGGEEIGRTTLNLPGHGHTAFASYSRFPATADGRGILEFRAQGSTPVSVLGLRFNANSFTTIPVLAK